MRIIPTQTNGKFLGIIVLSKPRKDNPLTATVIADRKTNRSISLQGRSKRAIKPIHHKTLPPTGQVTTRVPLPRLFFFFRAIVVEFEDE